MTSPRLSPSAALAWDLSANEAAAARHAFIEREHLALGILGLGKLIETDKTSALPKRLRRALREDAAAVETALAGIALTMGKAERGIRGALAPGRHEHKTKTVHRSAACKEIFSRAIVNSTGGEVSAVRLLAEVLKDPGSLIEGVLGGAGAVAALREALLRLETLRDSDPDNAPTAVLAVSEREPQRGTMLERFGRDLTNEAREGRLGPVIGRRRELLEVIRTLARKSKNNPVLVGEAGVGKTAIAEALALRIIEGKDGKVLAGKRLVELNMGALLGGSKYRGEFEERLTKVLAEAKADPSIILMIDEIHTVVGAGRSEGSMDAANILKPALARGELRCLGATTVDEYRRYIEQDAALERRFEKILVLQPSRSETLEILRGLRKKLEDHHGCRIEDLALEAAVDLSIRFDTDHQLPDKALDLIDKAGASSQVPTLSFMAGAAPLSPATPGRATAAAVAKVLAEKLGIPLDVVSGSLEGDGGRVLGLEAFLRGAVIGQEEAVAQVSRRLAMAHSGLGPRRGPLAVFLFLGPTGVGKTQLAQSIAEFLVGGESGLLRIDMSEYMEEHSVAKLIGSPPGYVGHKEEGRLTGGLRSKPYAVVLLDEAEKAHPRVFDLFLQVFDEGRLTDSKGRTVDCRNAVFIMTSNLGSDHEAPRSLGFLPGAPEDSAARARQDAVNARFRREFLNRIDEQVVFKPLSEDSVRLIVRKMAAEIAASLRAKHKAELTLAPEAETLIVEAGTSPRYGVRELRRTLERLLTVKLSDLVLSGRVKKSPTWLVVRRGDSLDLAPSE